LCVFTILLLVFLILGIRLVLAITYLQFKFLCGLDCPPMMPPDVTVRFNRCPCCRANNDNGDDCNDNDAQQNHDNVHCCNMEAGLAAVVTL
jgi:hypothetical protein